MKKVLIAVLTLTMLLTAAVGAMAETFTLSVPCQAIADSQLYNHHATAFAYKRNNIVHNSNLYKLYKSQKNKIYFSSSFNRRFYRNCYKRSCLSNYVIKFLLTFFYNQVIIRKILKRTNYD